MPDNDKPVTNPLVVLREEFDDWAVLFDPDSGNAFGLNPTGVFIWKQLNGRRTTQDILKSLHENCEEVPNEVQDHLNEFIQDLVEQGLAGYEAQAG
jgi:SynChlorMet cassette protein ScmD